MNEEKIFQYIKKDRGLDFLNPSFTDLYRTQFNPSNIKNMNTVKNEIISHIKFNSKILIFNDYDVDGILGGWILFDYLYHYKNANVNVKISNRKLGYGLSDKEVQEIISNKYDLVITVDCGIAEHRHIKQLQKNDIDVIVTDHHESNNPPSCDWIDIKVGKRYWERNLSGAGVAYKLISALEGEHMQKYLGALAIANIADFVPLRGENRITTKLGLEKLNKNPYYPLEVLMREFNIDKINSTDVAFKIAPSINSTNRVDHSRIVFELMTGVDIKKNAKEMRKVNNKRKRKVKQALEGLEVDDDNNIIIAKGNFKSGYTGLLASKLKDRYNKPAIVINQNNRGSARSIYPLNMFKVLDNEKQLFNNVGGHAFAGGFSLKEGKLEQLKSYLYARAEGLKYVLREVDLKLDNLEGINTKLMDRLDILEPFGAGNNKPYFKIKNTKLSDYNTTKTGEHLQLEINGKRGIWFNFNKKIDLRKELEINFEVQRDNYRGEGVQLIVRDIKEEGKSG